MARENNNGDQLIVTNVFTGVNWGIEKSKVLSPQNMLSIMFTGSTIRKDTRLTLGIKSRTDKGTFHNGVMNNITLDIMYSGIISQIFDIMADNLINKKAGKIWEKEVTQKIGSRNISFGIYEEDDVFYPVISIGSNNEKGETSQTFVIHFSEMTGGDITCDTKLYPQLSVDYGILKGLSQTFRNISSGTHPQISKHVAQLYASNSAQVTNQASSGNLKY